MNRSDVEEMTVRKINPAARVIDARRCNKIERGDNSAKATAAWKRKSYERNAEKCEQVLQMVLHNMTADEIAAVFHTPVNRIYDFIYRYGLPRPIHPKTKKKLMQGSK